MRERKRESEPKRVCKKDLKPLRQTSPEPPAAVRHVSRGRDFLALLGAKHGLECVSSCFMLTPSWKWFLGNGES